MTRGERVWCLGFGLALAFVTTLPFLLAYERQGAELRFTGSLMAVEDGNSYIAKMRRGSEGDWLFRTPYTAQAQSGVPAFLGYLLLGKLAAGNASHEQLVALFHLARILAIPFLVYATYRFVSRFLGEERWRRWATLLAIAGGGLGWLIFASGGTAWLRSPPLELYSPETFGFLGALTFPHLLLARAALLLALDSYLEGQANVRAAWVASAWLVVLVVLQPLSMAAAAAAIGAHQLLLLARTAWSRDRIRFWRSLRPAVLTLAAPGLLAGGYALLLQRDAFMRTWAAQNVLASPHIALYLLAYGLLLPLVVLGIRHAWQDGGADHFLLVGWVLALPVLAYLPVTFQRRLPEGGWVALVALAAFGLAGSRWSEPGRWRVAVGVLALSSVSSLLLLAGTVQAALSGAAPVFQDRAQVAGFQWLEQNAGPGSTVLAAYETGNALPAWAPVFVVIGHGPESAGLRELEPRVQAYFSSSGATPDGQTLLEEQGVSFVFVGEAERAAGFTESRASPSLVEAYRQGGVVIYRVGSGSSTGDDGTGVSGSHVPWASLAGQAPASR